LHLLVWHTERPHAPELMCELHLCVVSQVVGELERLQNGKVKCRLADMTDGKENVQT
jgi:hypothetical protein